jgi:cell wall-associated NlpC family hydrolase
VSATRGAAPVLGALAAATGILAVVVLAPAVALLGLRTGPLLPSAAARARVPPAMLALYRAAAATCPGLPWTVLAAIGTVESENGQSDLPGVHSGANAAGAEGPMQFLPATFAAYDHPVPPGGAVPPSPYDPVDAVFAAARLLCADGAAGGVDVPGAVFAYNHAAAYVDQVLALAGAYASGGTPAASAAPGGAGDVVVSWALAQIGTPYIWGGESPGAGFDCSGLVQAAWAAAGVHLPRVAQDQYAATRRLAPGQALVPGDLVFFGTSPTLVDHVGLYVGADAGTAVMVDAPHAGADVRTEPFVAAPGAPFGTLVYLGAGRP